MCANQDAIQLIAEGSAKLASVPSGGAGGAAPAAGAAAGGAAAEAPKEEAKEEGTHFCRSFHMPAMLLTSLQRRRSPTTTWDSVSSTKHPISYPNQPESTKECVEGPDLYLQTQGVGNPADSSRQLELWDVHGNVFQIHKEPHTDIDRKNQIPKLFPGSLATFFSPCTGFLTACGHCEDYMKRTRPRV